MSHHSFAYTSDTRWLILSIPYTAVDDTSGRNGGILSGSLISPLSASLDLDRMAEMAALYLKDTSLITGYMPKQLLRNGPERGNLNSPIVDIFC